jgi:hypothetical protein
MLPFGANLRKPAYAKATGWRARFAVEAAVSPASHTNVDETLTTPVLPTGFGYALYRSRFLCRCAFMRLRRLCLAIFALRLFLSEPIQVFKFASPDSTI